MSIKKIKAERPAPIDITSLYIDLVDKYRNVFILQLEDNVMIYRSLGRRIYKDILGDKKLTDLQKEEVICRECLLYPDPEKFDWETCDAGVPTQLRKAILKNSYLESIEDGNLLKKYYRSEMYDLDNQITCIINEAFPNIDIEEIETWDMEKTMKYYTRAEWKLQNLRGITFTSAQPQQQQQQSARRASRVTHRGTDKSQKLTPENIDQKSENKVKPLQKDKSGMSYEEFVAKFPEFANDSVIAEGVDAFKGKEFSTISPALRTGL